MKLFEGKNTVVSVVKKGGVYYGSYSAPRSALEEMVGARPQWCIRARHPELGLCLDHLRQIGIRDVLMLPDDEYVRLMYALINHYGGPLPDVVWFQDERDRIVQVLRRGGRR